MKYLILGGAGFLGAWITKTILAEKENSVIIFDKERADFSKLNPNENLEFQSGDFREFSQFDKLVQDCDVVIHLISTTTPATIDNSIAREIDENIKPTTRLLEACGRAKVKKFVFISSGGTVYGKQESNSPIKESNATNPISLYGFQKLMIEKAIEVFHHSLGLDYKILRLSNPYGPLQNPLSGQGVISAFTYRIIKGMPIKLFGKGDVIRDFIYVQDAIEMIMNTIKCEKSGTLYNIGTGIGYSINQILKIIESLVKKKANIEYCNERPSDIPVNILDISKYLSEVSNVPPRPIEEGIGLLIKYFLNEMLQ